MTNTIFEYFDVIEVNIQLDMNMMNKNTGYDFDIKYGENDQN